MYSVCFMICYYVYCLEGDLVICYYLMDQLIFKFREVFSIEEKEAVL